MVAGSNEIIKYQIYLNILALEFAGVISVMGDLLVLMDNLWLVCLVV